MATQSLNSSQPLIAIVGNGMVSHSLCMKLVQKKAVKRFQLVVFGDEPRPAYDRVHMTDFFSGRSANELELASREWYASHNITLHVNERVTRVDRLAKNLFTSHNRQLPYAKLIFATGSRPFMPSIEGINLSGIFPYRTIEDLEAIQEYSRNVRSAAVMGGGLLGLEAAKALCDLGLDTHVIEMAPALMPRQLDANGAEVLQRKVEQMGVKVHLLKRSQKISSDGHQRILHFDTGDKLSVDMVVVSAGIRPQDEIAKQAGLTTGRKGGIEVNDRLETSDPSIFALGECAVHKDVIYGLVAPGYQMADVLASNLLGGTELFEGGDQSARLKLMGVDVATIGSPLGETTDASIVEFRSPTVSRKLILKKRRVVGAIAVGSWPEIDRVRHAIASGQRLWAWNLNRFEASGNLWNSNRSQSITDWPASAIVCSCMNVSRGAISEARQAGCQTVEQVAEKTGASTVCGSCSRLLGDFMGAAAPRQTDRWKGLGAASVVASIVPLFWLAGPVAFSDSVTTMWHSLDAIWRDAVWKQITGYTLLAISLVSLVLPARKRIKWFTKGDFSFWRTVHSVLGLLTLIGLAIHTGLHMGANLNFVLAFTFLGLNLAGAITGTVAAWEYRAVGETARRLRAIRPRLAKLHLLFAWPLPVLLIFHIACAYYY